MIKIKTKKGKKNINLLVSKKTSFRKVNYKKKLYIFPNIKCSSHIALIAKKAFLLKKKQMDIYVFKLNRILKKSLINIYGSVHFNKTFTQKSKQSRMGKGKADIVDLIGNVGQFDSVFEFKFNVKEKKKKKKRMRKLLRSKIRMRGVDDRFIRFNRMIGRFLKFSKIKKVIRRRKKKKKIIILNKKKLKFFFNFFFFFHKLNLELDLIYEMLNDLFFFYSKKLLQYFSLISKMNFFFVKKNKYASFDNLLLFFSKNSFLCKSLFNFFFKYKFGMPLLAFPFDFELLFNGRNKNTFIGRR